MAQDLIRGCHYDTLAYGTVEFKRKMVTKGSDGDNIVYKFVTTNNMVKYIKLEELDTFLRKEQ